MIACCLTVLLGVLGQWSPLNVERIDPAPILRVMSNTSQTVSACGPGWVAAGYATTSPPATLVYGAFGGPPQTQELPYCYGIHGRGDRLAVTRSAPKSLDLYRWTGAAFALEQSIDLSAYLASNQWPYHVYVTPSDDVLIATGYPAPTRLLAVRCPPGGAPVVYPPVEVGATGTLKAWTGVSLIVGDGVNQPNVRAWAWSGASWTGTLLPSTPGNDLHTFRAGGGVGDSDQLMVRSRSIARNRMEWNWLRTGGALGQPVTLEIPGYPLDELVTWTQLRDGWWLTVRKVDSWYGALELTRWDMTAPVPVIEQRRRAGRPDGCSWTHTIVPLGVGDGLAGFYAWQDGEIYWVRVSPTTAVQCPAPTAALSTTPGQED